MRKRASVEGHIGYGQRIIVCYPEMPSIELMKTKSVASLSEELKKQTSFAKPFSSKNQTKLAESEEDVSSDSSVKK